MDNFEKVEKIREKTGVSYEEAKAALEANNYDLLDAVIALEKQGKTGNGSARYSTNWDSHTNIISTESPAGNANRGEAGDSMKNFFNWVGNLVKRAWENKFIISKDNREVGQMPVLVLILLMIGFFWITVPLMIIGLFFDFRYHFRGGSKIEVDLNQFCEKATGAAQDLKNDFRNNRG